MDEKFKKALLYLAGQIDSIKYDPENDPDDLGDGCQEEVNRIIES